MIHRRRSVRRRGDTTATAAPDDRVVEIRCVGPADIDLVLRAADVFDHVPRDETTARFLASTDHHLLLALDRERPVGFVSGVELTHPDKDVEMFLYELGVVEDARGKGVGTA